MRSQPVNYRCMTDFKKMVAEIVAELKKIRKSKGLSHEKIADKAGIHRSTISLIESGKNQATLITCLKIADVLECDLGKIITKINNKLAKEY